MKQRDVFLQSEGDPWLERNTPRGATRTLPESDEVLLAILQVPIPHTAAPNKLLEIGCASGWRLAWVRENRGFDCYGLDPSAQAVDAAAFDVVEFGCCPYFCNREDQFLIGCEADSVSRNPGWLVIQDFYSATPCLRPYHDRSGICSFKMDYRDLFARHPGHSNYFHKIGHQFDDTYTDDPNEWVATSVVRKYLVPRG